MTRPDIPEFEKPPIHEVSLGMQFDVPNSWQNIYARDVWQLYEKDFPKIAERPEMPPMFELFGGVGNTNMPLGMPFSFDMGGRLYWFISNNEIELIQFQRNKFVHNWRKLQQEQNKYPRFEAISESYEKELETLTEFYKSKGWGPLSINQCELSYTNVIQLSDFADPIAGNYFPVFSHAQFQYVPGNMDYGFQHRETLFNGTEGSPIGRLIVTANTGIIEDKPIVQLQITGRGAPETNDMYAGLHLLSELRDEIVTLFAEITSPQAHKIWERKS